MPGNRVPRDVRCPCACQEPCPGRCQDPFPDRRARDGVHRQVAVSDSARDGGAALIEYALVLSVLVGAVLAVLPALGTGGAAVVDRQAVCIATRPAAPACHQAP
jgi:hypothetical protein